MKLDKAVAPVLKHVAASGEAMYDSTNCDCQARCTATLFRMRRSCPPCALHQPGMNPLDCTGSPSSVPIAFQEWLHEGSVWSQRTPCTALLSFISDDISTTSEPQSVITGMCVRVLRPHGMRYERYRGPSPSDRSRCHLDQRIAKDQVDPPRNLELSLMLSAINVKATTWLQAFRSNSLGIE